MPPKRKTKATKGGNRLTRKLVGPATPAPESTPQPTTIHTHPPKTLPPTTVNTTNTAAATDTPLVPTQRLYHATVDVKLTADPILQVIRNMSAQAIQDIQTKAAAATSRTRGGGFDWVAAATQSIEQAEAKARQAILEYVAPVAQKAFEDDRASEGEGEGADSGVPVVTPMGDGERGVVAGPVPVPVGEAAGRGASSSIEPAAVAAGDEGVEEDGDAEMIDAAGAGRDVEDEDDWTSTCFCGLQDNGDLVFKCAGADCRHTWYHKACLEKAVHKKNLPSVDKDEDWFCPYCGKYNVKAAMVPETIFGKGKGKALNKKK